MLTESNQAGVQQVATVQVEVQYIVARKVEDIIPIGRLCMSCTRRPATKITKNARGKKQYRCDICSDRKNPSGFK